MTAHAPAVTGPGKFHGTGKGKSIGHERGGGDDPTRMCLSNGAINALGEAKIVSIDNEAPHAKSLAGRSNSGWRTENGEQRMANREWRTETDSGGRQFDRSF